MVSLADPQLDEQTVERVSELLRSGTLSTGRIVSEFETAFRSIADREHAAAVASGSVALETTLEALFDRGDRIAVSPYNCGAVLYSILRSGLKPEFVDAEPDTCAIDPNGLDAVGKSLDGVVVTHLFGQPARIHDLLNVANERDITVVEDFAQAPGATVNDRPAGSFGKASVCSFGATKNITTAEGGMVLTDDESLAQRVVRGRSNTDDTMPPPRSVRMNDVEAAIGIGQLREYDDTVKQKRRIADVYRDEINIGRQPVVRSDATHVYHAYPLRHPDADQLADHLETHGIGTSRLYNTPLHKYEAAPHVLESYPVAEALSAEVVLLPIHGGMTMEDAHEVARVVGSF